MRLLIAAALLTSHLGFAATVDDVLAAAERVAAASPTGTIDDPLTRHLRTLEKKLGVTLPIDPAAVRKGEPKAGSARWGNASFSDQGPRRPHLIGGTLALPRSGALAGVGGSLVVVHGNVSLGFVVDSIVIATGDVSIANLTNSVVVAGGHASISHLDGSAVLAQRIENSSLQQKASKLPCVLGASVGVRLQWLGASCTLLNTPAWWVRGASEGMTLTAKADPSVSTARPFETSKTLLTAAPACRAALAQGAKAGDVSVGVTSVPWRAQRGAVPADLESTRVLDVYDSAIALERGGAVSLVKAAPSPADAPALRQAELLELGGEFELHGIGFSQPGQLEPTQVKVMGAKPIVLVLASGEGARWQVDVEPEATLRAVVLLGGAGQQLRFGKTSAPVVLDLNGWPCVQGKAGTRWDPLEGQAEEPKVIATVLSLLGRRPPLAFTSVQRGTKAVTGSMGEPSYVVGAPPPKP
ncbi:MAG: hypothetical protein Q8L14_34200 [Myxococcales bacterium]|nr:hypothetical protein [Myxococcales bacterium]